MPNALKMLLIAFAGGLLLSGCGVRGSLEAPPGSAGSGDGPEVVEGDGNAGSGQKRHDGFVLDGLLR